jgi:multiple sugar transport system ATP-binding protein
MTMADTLVVLEKGKIMQQGTPNEVYHRPANVFTARFIGSPPINILQGSAREGELCLESVSSPICHVTMPDGDYLIGIRPDDLVASFDSAGISMTIERVEFHGATTYLYGRIGEQGAMARGAERRHFEVGETIRVAFQTEVLHFFNAQTQGRCG